MLVEQGDKVTINYTGKLDDGCVFTTSSEDGPITFQVGRYDMIQGLNSAVLGMSEGESRSVQFDPSDAFGDYKEDLVITYPLKNLPPETLAGTQFRDDDTGNIWTVKEVNESEGMALMDGNHILAGRKLNFDIEVVKVERLNA